VLRPGPLGAALRGLVRLKAGGLAGHVELRTGLIDEAVREAVAEGLGQTVVLGAGLDARAWRMAELSAVDVIEVDHPATQAFKRARVEGLPHTARSVAFAPVDFERASLRDGLLGAGHHPDRATLWVWEGVTPYLQPAAIDHTLDVLAAASAPGSRLVLSYCEPSTVAWRLLAPLARLALRWVGEPLLGLISRDQMTQKLQARGFRILRDELPAAAGPRFGVRRWRGPFGPEERVAVAVRTR
jgi:methyltransferase (TIGR00027 family)